MMTVESSVKCRRVGKYQHRLACVQSVHATAFS